MHALLNAVRTYRVVIYVESLTSLPQTIVKTYAIVTILHVLSYASSGELVLLIKWLPGVPKLRNVFVCLCSKLVTVAHYQNSQVPSIFPRT